MSNRRRRPITDPRSASSASSLLTQMFEWSENPVNVRSFVDKRLSAVPTLVRIITGYTDQSKRYSFQPGSLYLIRSMFSQLLVVARTKDSKYLTIPLTSTLKFHLLDEDDEHKTSAVDPQTLADMLSITEVTSFEGHRIRLASVPTSGDRVWDGELQLVAMYNEKFLLGYAFSGATLTGDVKIIPGYIPVSMQIARSMHSRSASGNYQQYVNQLMAVTELFQPDHHNVSSFLEDLTVHKNEPHNEYESIDGPYYSLQLPHQPNYINITSPAITPRASFNSSMSPTSSVSSSVYEADISIMSGKTTPDSAMYQFSQLYQTPTNTTPSSSMYQSPNGIIPANPDSSNYQSSPLYQSSTIIRLKARPLPSIPAHSSTMSTTWISKRCETSTNSTNQEFDETLIETFKTRRKAAACVTMSMPVMHRTNSDPNLLDDVEESSGLTQRSRLSSQSFEDIVVHQDNCQASLTSELTTTVPSKQSMEQLLIGDFDKSSYSMLRRRQPVLRSRKGFNIYKNMQFRQQTLPAIHRSTTGVTYDNMESNKSTKRTSYTDEDINENIYEQIKSPIYCDMSMSSTFPRMFRREEYKRTHTTTSVTSPTSDENSVYEEFRPKLSTDLNTNDDLYANASAIRNVRSQRNEVNSDVVTPSGDVKRCVTSSHDIRSGIVKPMIRQTNSCRDEDDDGYCRPSTEAYAVIKRYQEHHRKTCLREPVKDRQEPSTLDQHLGDSVDFTTRQELSENDDVTWSSLEEVPLDVTSLTVNGVAACLRLLNLGQHVTRFRQEQIDGDLLSSLDKDILVEDFDFKRFDAIKLEKFARQGWRPRVATSAAATVSVQISSESYC